MQQVRAKKYLGQHFLTDLDVARRIAGSLPEGVCAKAIEIGPGMGVLTQFLLGREDIDLTAVEIDAESVAYLHRYYPQLDVREADFLKVDIDEIVPAGNSFMVIGNYPYNISSQIFFRVLDYRDRIPVCAGMIQKEVAERIAAPALQDLRHHAHPAAGILRHRVPLYRSRKRVQSAAESQVGGYPYDPQQPQTA